MEYRSSRPLKSIILLTASRGRPELFSQAYRAAIDLADCPQNIFVALRIDQDETPANIERYRRILKRSDSLIIGRRPSQSPSQIFQELCIEYKAYDVYFCLSDDTICRTKSWDTRILNHFNAVPGDPIIAQFRISDGINRERTLFFWSHEWIRTLGFILPPNLSCCEDIYVAEIGERLADSGYNEHYKYIDDIVFEHLHYAFRKRPKDNTDREGDRRRIKHGDRQSYNQFRPYIQAHVDRLITCIQEGIK